MDWGKLYTFEVGEQGRGRRLLRLPCWENTPDIKEGMNNLSIGLTRTGKPRIVNDDGKLYMLLSSEGGYTRRGDGYIQVLETQKDEVKILGRGNGADGAAGRIGTWDCLVMEVPETNLAVRVRTSGGGYGTPSDIYLVNEGKVYHATQDMAEEMFEQLGVEMPFKLNKNGEVDMEEWKVL